MSILSNGGNPDATFEQTKRICTLRDIYVHIAGWDNLEEFYRVGTDGVERGESLLSGEYSGKPFRVYVCGNCGLEFEGNNADSADKMREHIGKKNKYIHPFNLVLRGEEL